MKLQGWLLQSGWSMRVFGRGSYTGMSATEGCQLGGYEEEVTPDRGCPEEQSEA